ncbi:polysaccharide deacetylase family protein [Terriglobus sp. 2YAB30_2]|uniref:polysaccharide deacetylase family protein n=1 Tax=unclassified Terriglobus TaxID=2628988 RepID=UPI003F9DAD08
MLSPVLAGAAVAAGIGVSVYAAYRPESQLYGATLIAGSDPGQAALTYDDGPNPDATLRLLDILAQHQVHATFFMVGSFVKAEAVLARRVAAAGHLIGNHTLTHPNLAITSSRETRRQLTETNDILEQTLGQKIRFFRPPFGARRPATLRIARELGLIPVEWNVAAQDWNPASPQQLLERLERGIAANRKKGRASNLLLHDGSHLGLGAKRMPTVEATSLLLERNIRNLTFVTPEIWV